MDIAQLKHELPRQKNLDSERTVSHMYDLPQSRIRCGRSYLWYHGTWSPKSSSRSISCGTPVLGCRSRLGRSLVGSIALRLARRPVDHRTSALPTSASRHDLNKDSTDGPPVKKNNALSPVHFRRQVLQWRTNIHYFLKQKPSAQLSHTSEPPCFASKSLRPERYIRLGTNFLHYHNTPVTTPTTNTISTAEA